MPNDDLLHEEKKIKNKKRSEEIGKQYTEMGLKPNLPELQVLSKILEDGTNCIQLSGAGGCAGKRAIRIYRKFEPGNYESKGYHSDIYCYSLAKLLFQAEINILDGVWCADDKSSCHRCKEGEYTGETSLDTWLILSGELFCYWVDGKIVVEARKRGRLDYNESLFFRTIGKTLGDALQTMDWVMDQYDLSSMISELDFTALPSEAEVHNCLRLALKNTPCE